MHGVLLNIEHNSAIGVVHTRSIRPELALSQDFHVKAAADSVGLFRSSIPSATTLKRLGTWRHLSMSASKLTSWLGLVLHLLPIWTVKIEIDATQRPVTVALA